MYIEYRKNDFHFTYTILILIGLPVLANETTRLVCRAKNAGNCKTSATFATGSDSHISCTSVITDTLNWSFTACSISGPYPNLVRGKSEWKSGLLYQMNL
jgi:hypothetical protein